MKLSGIPVSLHLQANTSTVPSCLNSCLDTVEMPFLMPSRSITVIHEPVLLPTLTELYGHSCVAGFAVIGFPIIHGYDIGTKELLQAMSGLDGPLAGYELN